MKKKRTKRSEAKYPALDPKLNLKTRFDQLDFDYINQLPEEWTDPLTGKKYNPKEYLNNFVNESVHADFSNKKRIHKKKRVESEKNKSLNELKVKLIDIIKQMKELIDNTNVSNSTKIKLQKILSKLKNNLRKQIKAELSYIDDVYKKEAYDKNNSRNRCVLTRARAQGKVLGFDLLPESYMVESNVEDTIIEKLDLAKKLQNSDDSSNSGSNDT